MRYIKRKHTTCLLILWFSKDDKGTNTEKPVCMPVHSDRNFIVVSFPYKTGFRELLRMTEEECLLSLAIASKTLNGTRFGNREVS